MIAWHPIEWQLIGAFAVALYPCTAPPATCAEGERALYRRRAPRYALVPQKEKECPIRTLRAPGSDIFEVLQCELFYVCKHLKPIIYLQRVCQNNSSNIYKYVSASVSAWLTAHSV